MSAPSAGLPWTRLAVRVPLFAGLWLVIAGTDPAAWLVGAPAIAAATWASLHLTQGDAAAPFSIGGALRFGGFFLWESLRGGIDVAARTLGPRLRIRPGFIDYRCRLPGGRPRVLFANCVSLLPGTLAADLRDLDLSVHVLDLDSAAVAELGRLETAVARLFGLTLETRHA